LSPRDKKEGAGEPATSSILCFLKEHEKIEKQEILGKGEKRREGSLKAHAQSSYIALISITNTMQSIAQVQNVQKINAVSTGKVANEKSMMVWRPHGNK
jgi:hypothetical protein